MTKSSLTTYHDELGPPAEMSTYTSGLMHEDYLKRKVTVNLDDEITCYNNSAYERTFYAEIFTTIGDVFNALSDDLYEILENKIETLTFVAEVG